MESRPIDHQSIVSKHEQVRRNAILLLERATQISYIIGGKSRTVFEILSESYKPNTSGWTLYPEESKALLGFVSHELARIS